MQLCHDLNISQKTAWFLAHRIRKEFVGQYGDGSLFPGPVEVDEACMAVSGPT